MKYNGTEGEAIDIAQAAAWTANYRNGVPSETVRSHFFGNQILRKILEQEQCVGIRMYYGIDDAGTRQLILIGVDENGNDLESGTVADRSRICPPDCGSDGVLSS